MERDVSLPESLLNGSIRPSFMITLDVNCFKIKYSALLKFVSKKLEESFKSVLSRKCKDFNINAVYERRALLHFLSVEGKENLVKYLLEFGPNVNLKDNDGETDLFYAVTKKNPRFVRLLLKYCTKMHGKQFPLENFFKTYDLASDNETIKFLLQAGCDVRPENKGMLPILKIFDTFTCDFINFENDIQNWEIVKLLCAHGAEICLKNETGINLLHYFCKTGRLDDVRFAVKYGVDLFFERDGSTALHYAVLGNNLDLIDFLIRNGLDINAQDHYDETPLYRISSFSEYSDPVPGSTQECRDKREKECVNMIEFLVDNGANVNINLSSPVTMVPLFMDLVEILECLLELKAHIFNLEHVIFVFPFGRSFHQSLGINLTRSVILELLIAILTIRKNDISQSINKISDKEEFKWIKAFFEHCKFEVNEMKRRNICHERNISLFDFLSKDLMEVAIFSRNEELMLVLESGDYMKDFPFYEYLLGKRMARVQLLRTSINLFTRFLEKNFNNKLPIVVLDIILSFLRVGDLRNFARALRVSKDFPNGKYCIE